MGLPAEFVLGRDGQPPPKIFKDTMSYTLSLLANNMALGYHAKAAPPTVTFPCLKVMTTGSKLVWELHHDQDKALTYFEKAVFAAPEDRDFTNPSVPTEQKGKPSQPGYGGAGGMYIKRVYSRIFTSCL